jgi:RNA polymerase sigma-70 factor (ECF subfamily)
VRAAERQEVEQSIRELIERGDLRGAATAAIRGYGPQILSSLRAVLDDEDAAADGFSRFGEAVWKGIGRFRGDSSVLTWSYSLAWGAVRHVKRDPFRRRARRLETSEASRLVADVRASASADRSKGAREGVARLRASLDPDEQTLLILRVDRDLPWRDVARVLAEEGQAIDEAALRKRYERVKAKLKKLGREEGLIGRR